MRRWFIALTLSLTVAMTVGTASAVSAQTLGPADTIRDVRFGDHITYERMVLDLGYEEFPADFAPNYWWTYNGGGTILRMNLPSISSSFVTDGYGLGKGIYRYYVVRGINGQRLSTEVHLTDAAGPATVFYLNYPARIVIDIPTGGQSFMPDPTIGDNVVVKQPRAGYTVGPGIFTIAGYGRPFGAVGDWRILDASGAVARQGTYGTSDWATTWGRFNVTADYPAYLSGQSGTLQVGQYSARDGNFQGVSIPLNFR